MSYLILTCAGSVLLTETQRRRRRVRSREKSPTSCRCIKTNLHESLRQWSSRPLLLASRCSLDGVSPTLCWTIGPPTKFLVHLFATPGGGNGDTDAFRRSPFPTESASKLIFNAFTVRL